MMEQYEMVLLKPSQLKVDKRYQREVNQAVIKKIVRTWDEKLVDPPKVSLRPDKYYYIINGQHTVAAWTIVHGDEPIKCRVYTGLSENDEKDLFIKQNGTVTNIKVFEKLQAEYNFDDPDITGMIDSAKLLGLTVKLGVKAYGNNIINSPECLYSIYKELGKDNYINVLTVIKNAWDGEKESLSRGILRGVAFIYEHFSDKVTNAMMIEALKRHSPDYYLREAKETSGPLSRRVARAMIKTYNYRKTINRLPEF